MTDDEYAKFFVAWRANRAKLGKAVHRGALNRLHELFPCARVSVRQIKRPATGLERYARMDDYTVQEEHETIIVIDLAGDKRPGTGGKAIGVARCHPSDNFDRRKGLKLAFDRALDNARKAAA